MTRPPLPFRFDRAPAPRNRGVTPHGGTTAWCVAMAAAALALAAPAPLGAAPDAGPRPAASAGAGATKGAAAPAGPEAPLAPGHGPPQQIERPDPCPRPLEVLVARPFADDRGLAPGDPVGVKPAPGADGCPATVAGVFRPRADPAELTRDRPRVLFHLPDLAGLAGRQREVDRFSVRLRPGADAADARRDLAALLPGARVVPTGRVAEESSTAFRVVRRFHRAIALVTLAAGSVFLACIMTLKVQERRAEVAALRLAGISRRTLLGWIMAEATLVSVVGGALGVGLGRLASGAINRVYRGLYDTSLTFSVVTAETVTGVLALAVVLGLGAGLAAGLHLLSLDPLDEVGR